MRFSTLALATISAFLCCASTTSLAQDGASKAAACAACHGPGGNSANPEWPNLAGQHASYTARQLAAFKSGQRKNDLMKSMADSLSDQDVQDIAHYFAAQTSQIGSADEKLVARGEAIYRGGIKADGVPACMACHGPNGAGNPGAAYPRLSGQQAVYTEKQLLAYRSGERSTDQNAVMRTISMRLNAEDIKALASYVSGLH